MGNLTDGQPNTDFTTVPTGPEKQGDFSALLKVGSSYQIYHPDSGVLNGTTVTNKPFLNNIVPTSRLNPIVLNY